MTFHLHSIPGTSLAEVLAAAPVIQTAADGTDLVGNVAFGGFDGVLLLARHLTPDFFDLKTGLAGEVLQKFSTYRLRLAIIGDFSQYPGRSIRDFIRESNQRGQVLFAESREAALARLAA